MSELERVAAEWKSKPRSESGAYYDKEVIPRVMDLVVPRERNKLKLTDGPGYEGLILSLGQSPEPLAISIAVWQPQRILLLVTKESRTFLDRVLELARIPYSKVDVQEIDSVDTNRFYIEVKKAYQRWDRPTNVAIDITGGTKAMVAAAALAANVLKFDVVYVKSEYLKEYGHPEPGTETVVRLDNPLNVFGDLEFQTAQRLAEERQDYGGAARLLEDLSKVVEGENSLVYGIWAKLYRAYEAWDQLDVKLALDYMEESERGLNQHGGLPSLAPLKSQRERLTKQKQALRLMAEELPHGEKSLAVERLANPAIASAILATVYHMALRRKASGRLDMATLLWYRLLEMLEQTVLATLGVDTSAPDYPRLAHSLGISVDKLLQNYNEQRSEIKRGLVHELPSPIALIDGYILLAALGKPLYPDHLGKLVGRVAQRNFSIFAHGYSFISLESSEKLHKEVELILDKFIHYVDLDRQSWDEMAFLSKA
ncbi:MAG: TIGR02710 family CRISPR-associated CARF protein [Candidatus Methanomethyliaceae archaeon]